MLNPIPINLWTHVLSRINIFVSSEDLYPHISRRLARGLPRKNGNGMNGMRITHYPVFILMTKALKLYLRRYKRSQLKFVIFKLDFGLGLFDP